MKVEIRNATQLLKSSGEGKRIDVSLCTNAMQRLETNLETAMASGFTEGSLDENAAKRLISALNVKL